MIDLSEKYAKMSIKAYPFLKECIPYYSERKCMWYVNIANNEYARWMDRVNTNNYQDWKPLLSQDLLQEIVEFDFKNIKMVNKFVTFLREWLIELNSWDQIWLGFVMQEKFHRHWNDSESEWIEDIQDEEKSDIYEN